MKPLEYDLEIWKGQTFEKEFLWMDPLSQPIDLSQATAKMQIRPTALAPLVIVELSTENGRIILNSPLGGIKLVLPANDSTAIPQTRGVYDLEIYFPNSTCRFAQGNVVFHNEVTR